MSAAGVLQAALVAALESATEMLGCRWFDAPPDRAGVPYGVVEWPVLGDCSTKTNAGFEGRLVLTLVDDGEWPARLRLLLGVAEDAVADMDSVLAEGWQLLHRRPQRSRMARGRDGRWTGTSEFLVRMYRLNG